MSNPPNPLDRFRSYSYHHILVACDGTNTADALNEAPISAYDHPSDKFCPQSILGGNYIVLINGTTDAQFYISTAKWSSVAVPRVGGREQSHASTTMAVDGELQIVEPRGVNFYNVLNQATKSLRIDPSAMVYVLKTIFVGIADDGFEEVISTIRPIPFILTDITSTFDHTGAEYAVSFVGMVNGAGKLPSANSIVQGFSGKLGANQSIPDALRTIQFQLNHTYREQRSQTIQNAVKCNPQLDFSVEDEFMDVNYVIECSSLYNNYVAGTALPVSRTGDGKSDTYISDFGENTTVERIIDEVMRSSKDVLDDLEGEPTTSVADSKRKMYKITSDVRIDRSLNLYTITYHVNQYIGTIVPADKIETFVPTGPTGDEIGITFDYIFTGQNIDVLEFNLDMQYGLTFLQMLGTSTSCPTSRIGNKLFSNPEAQIAGIGNKDGAGDQKSPSAFCSNATQSTADDDNVVKKPLFLGSMVTHPSFRDTRVPGAATGFNSLLHRIAALENIGARMKIRGNPQMLEDSILRPQDLGVEQGTSETVPFSDRSIIPNMNSVPGYVKVNVMMPRAWQMDEVEGDPLAEAAGDYASAFWYNGWYQLLQIDHVFSDGEFTQELEIYSLPTDAGQSSIGKCIDDANSSAKTDPGRKQIPVPANPGATKSSGTDGVPGTNEKTVGKKTVNQLAADRDGTASGEQ